ncbi:hypothetical protein [Nocardioides sp. URHA0020]|uniref:hypothetical protein n=1 Tax=Nocardioides sp. URHA0020 TaxID=1380392 RepID=UPI00048C29F4|nr:hypothetical protein [Nocardioides sp. URHA0020]
MSTQAVAAPARRPRALLPDLVVRGIAGALVVTSLVLLGTLLVAGERPTSYAELRAAVAAGRVDRVDLEGGLHGDVEGFAGVTVHWRDGLVGRVTTVTEATSRRDARDVGVTEPVVVGRVDEQLRALDPGLRTTRSGRQSDGELGPWRVPAWMVSASIVLFAGALGLLIVGREPWRATRWAWFWLIGGVPIVGALAFLLLGGSTGLMSPARPERRLTGGWSFLLTALLHGVGAAVLAALL